MLDDFDRYCSIRLISFEMTNKIININPTNTLNNIHRLLLEEICSTLVIQEKLR